MEAAGSDTFVSACACAHANMYVLSCAFTHVRVCVRHEHECVNARMRTCLRACVPACVPACLPAYERACLRDCGHATMYACRPACVRPFLRVSMLHVRHWSSNTAPTPGQTDTDIQIQTDRHLKKGKNHSG